MHELGTEMIAAATIAQTVAMEAACFLGIMAGANGELGAKGVWGGGPNGESLLRAFSRGAGQQGGAGAPPVPVDRAGVSL